MQHSRVSILLSAASLPLLVVALATARAPAQVKPGEYLATVVQARVGEMYRIDSHTRKATQLKLSTPADVNCVTMQNAVTGWVGTNFSPAKIYKIRVIGTNVQMTLLFKTATALTGQTNISQIARLGANLWFVTNPGGTLWKVPAAGGVDPTKVLDLSAQTTWRRGALANAIATDGRLRLYVAVWTLGEVYEYNWVTKKTTLLLTLPTTKGSTARGFFPVNMHYRGGKLYAAGLYGDVVRVDLATKKVTQYWHPTPRETGLSTLKNSFAWNPDQGHYGMGSRDGALDIVVPVGKGQLARIDVDGVGTNARRTLNSVNGLYYQPGATSSYQPYAAGCAGSSMMVPTSVGRGLPSRGNARFALGLDTAPAGVNIAILLIGASKVSVSLAGIGLPTCNLLTLPILSFAVPTTNGSVDGRGTATVPVPLPNAALQLHTQWLVWNSAAKRFDAASDGRTLTLR